MIRRSPGSTLSSSAVVRPARRQLVASIGPSSAESRWSNLHLSYSLTYHLVGSRFLPNLLRGKSLLILFLCSVGLEYAGNADPAGIDLLSFQDRFDRSEGRISGLGSIEEVSFVSLDPSGAILKLILVELGSSCAVEDTNFWGCTSPITQYVQC